MKLKSKLINGNTSFIFIVVNILVAFFGFARSFVFMNFFDFKELGFITLISTAAMLISFFQVGLINGGYRIIALQEKSAILKLNNVIFSYFGILTFCLLGFTIVILFFGLLTDWIVAILVIALGILTLVTNWLTNSLIGGSEYKRLNIANIVSSLLSLASLVLAYYLGLSGAIISLLIQPLLFVGVVFFTDKKEIPTAFDLDFNYIKYILSFGFIPYVSSIFFFIYQQIERWSINSYLGSEALGKMYLFFLTTTLWTLVPSSVANLLFPKAIKCYSDNDIVGFKNTIKLSSIIAIVYCIIGVLALIFILNPIIDLIFPKHQKYFYLVTLGLPGFVFRSLCDPVNLYLCTIVRLKPILWSDIISLIIYSLFISYVIFYEQFSMSNFVICFDIYFLVKFINLLFLNFFNKESYIYNYGKDS